MILENFIQVILSSKVHIENGTLFCNEWKVTNKDILQSLYENNCIEQTMYLEDISINDKITLELSISKLHKIGFYDTSENFISKNKYKLPQSSFYIYEDRINSTDSSNEFIQKIKKVQLLIDSINSIAKHSFFDIDIQNAVITNEKQSVVIAFDYSYKDIQKLNNEKLQEIDDYSNVINGENLEKRNLFINELIDFLQDRKINNIKTLLESIEDLHKNCHNAYMFYISNFTSNKLKLEVNAKIIDYNQKIQSVINEAQTKLIAIPSAFVLTAVAMDFEKYRLILSSKNIITIISLYIFSFLIQLFLSNQKCILNNIENDIKEFKDSVKGTNSIMDKFDEVDNSLKEQKKRLKMIQFILWLIPIAYSLYLFIPIIFQIANK